MTITIPNAYAAPLAGVLADSIRCYQALQRLVHITAAEREIYQLHAAILSEIAEQLPAKAA